jgi:hypothetical protein
VRSCDDGINDGAYNTCNDDCTFAPRCGDGVKSPTVKPATTLTPSTATAAMALCAVETGYICTGTPSECIRIN